MGALLRAEVTRLAPAGALADCAATASCGVPRRGVAGGVVVEALVARGVLASTAGRDVVRCTPPFTIGGDEIDEGAKALAAALEEAA